MRMKSSDVSCVVCIGFRAGAGDINQRKGYTRFASVLESVDKCVIEGGFSYS